MATVDLIMPKMGESIMEATILKWHKATGDSIKMDETLLDIATDKVDSEVPSTAEGVVEEMLFAVNDVVPIGAVIARIKTGGEQTNKEQGTRNDEVKQQQPAGNLQFAGNESAQVVQKSTANGNGGSSTEKANTENNSGARFFSPLVLNIAGQEGVRLSELENISGTGNEGRVTKRDILQYVSERKAGKGTDPAMTVSNQPSNNEQRTTNNDKPTVNRQLSTVNAEVPATSDERSTSYSGNVEIIEMDRMRKLIADHMVRSKHTSPHVTSFTEADVTNLVMWREKVKIDFEKREGTKITFTPLFIEAIVRCIKKFPLINSSLDGTNIIVKKDINIGMATALPTGNLIVPVIKNADGLNLVGLAKKVNGLAEAARNNKLKPEDIADGTFTLTNVGTFGSLMGTPIINQPQVAILAVGAIKKRPVVIETPHGDSIAIRHMMYLSMSYDHRVVDGSLGATFLTAVGRDLENFDMNRDY